MRPTCRCIALSVGSLEVYIFGPLKQLNQWAQRVEIENIFKKEKSLFFELLAVFPLISPYYFNIMCKTSIFD